jgi:GT2 family glycosyltransferase
MAVMEGTAPLISVIIPCFQHASELVSCLQGLHRQEGGVPFDIIVVDSAPDVGVQAVAAGFPRVRLLSSERPLFAGAARNLGARQAAADILGFIDADCIPKSGWVHGALGAIREGAALAGGPILDALPWNLIASSDNRLQFVDFPERRPAGSCPYVPGAHLVMRRALFEQLGGFDERAEFAQDVLFAEKVARLEPGLVRYCPQMIVRHRGRAHWGEFLRHQQSFGYSRAEYGLRMNRSLTWLGRHRSLAWRRDARAAS